ncbi:6302_t:CDS:10, partial [Entrophospora sp. SA101]
APIAISPQKMNLVAGLIRKKELDYSLKILTFSPKKGGKILHKLLQGIAKNLEKNQEKLSNFYLSKIEVNQGRTQKRMIYRAKGRTDRIRKRYNSLSQAERKAEILAINYDYYRNSADKIAAGQENSPNGKPSYCASCPSSAEPNKNISKNETKISQSSVIAEIEAKKIQLRKLKVEQGENSEEVGGSSGIKSEEGKLAETIDRDNLRGERHNKYYLISAKQAELQKEEEHLKSLGLQRQRCWIERLDKNSILFENDKLHYDNMDKIPPSFLDSLRAQTEREKEINDKEIALQQAKANGESEMVAQLEQQIQELKNQQKSNNLSVENPTKNKLIIYSVIGLSVAILIKKQHALTEKENLLLVEKNKEIYQKINNFTLKFTLKKDEKNMPFGSVGFKEILQELEKNDCLLEKKHLAEFHPLNKLGENIVKVKLNPADKLYTAKKDCLDEVKRLFTTNLNYTYSHKYYENEQGEDIGIGKNLFAEEAHDKNLSRHHREVSVDTGELTDDGSKKFCKITVNPAQIIRERDWLFGTNNTPIVTMANYREKVQDAQTAEEAFQKEREETNEFLDGVKYHVRTMLQRMGCINQAMNDTTVAGRQALLQKKIGVDTLRLHAVSPPPAPTKQSESQPTPNLPNSSEPAEDNYQGTTDIPTAPLSEEETVAKLAEVKKKLAQVEPAVKGQGSQSPQEARQTLSQLERQLKQLEDSNAPWSSIAELKDQIAGLRKQLADIAPILASIQELLAKNTSVLDKYNHGGNFTAPTASITEFHEIKNYLQSANKKELTSQELLNINNENPNKAMKTINLNNFEIKKLPDRREDKSTPASIEIEYEEGEQNGKVYKRVINLYNLDVRYEQVNYVKYPIYDGYSERTKLIRKFDKIINPIKFVNEDILELDLEKHFILSIIEKISDLKLASNFSFRNLNDKKGVYIIRNETKNKCYVGQAKSIGLRLNQHFPNSEDELDSLEKQKIEEFNSFRDGYNGTGHAYTMVMADIIVRYKKSKGYLVYLQTGSDDHGEKIEKKAISLNLSPQELVDKNVLLFQQLWKELGISKHTFYRTSSPLHKEKVQKIFTKLLEKGDVYLGEYQGKYCITCEDYVSESKIVNQNLCPNPDCQVELRTINEPAYFLRVSKYYSRLKEYYQQNPDFLLPDQAKKELFSNFLDQNVPDLCITRREKFFLSSFSEFSDKNEISNAKEVSCVAIQDKNNNYLLVYNKKYHHWQFTGGELEQGENAEEAAKREIFEETNLVIKDLEKIAEENFYVNDIW